MCDIQESTTCLIDQVLTYVKQQVIATLDPCEKNHQAELLEALDNIPAPFSGIETEALHAAYVKKNFNYVGYKKICLGTRYVRRKKGPKRVISAQDESFIYIPILESLQQLLANKKIASIILKKAKCSEKGVLYDICDGSIFQNDNYFKDHPDALVIILYHDELEVCNPLGSKAGIHKLDMFYYTLANFTPKFRSKLAAVRLLAIVNANYVKKYGIERILEPIIKDINILHGGSMMTVNGIERIVFGKVLACAGDTLGQHLWGGYKEGVGFSINKCRTCYCLFLKMQQEFFEEAFVMRTQARYNEECEDIENAPTDTVRCDLCTTYGINKRSALCNLPDFDVTKQLPQDVMHTLLEGTVQYEVRLILLYFIQTGKLTLLQLNGAINNHNYGYSEQSDKPGPIRESVFQTAEGYKVKYSASQTRLFLRILPFIVDPMIDFDNEYYLFLVELIQIVNIVFAPVIKHGTVTFLQELIAKHLATFKELFPNKNVIPKQHYLVHIPGMIRLLGPMVRTSCFTFESAHRYFKELGRRQNFKNLPVSLARRHQMFECCNFGDSLERPGSHPLFATEKKCGVVNQVNKDEVKALQEKFKEFGLLPGITLEKVYTTSWITLYGTKYTKTAMLVVDVAEEPLLPIFGELKKIWLIEEHVYFELSLFETHSFDEMHQAYFVQHVDPEVAHFVSTDDLVDFNVLHLKKNQSAKSYVPVKYHLNDIMEEFLKDSRPMQ